MTTALTALSDQLADIVAQASAGVVRVEARRRMPASGIVWSADGHIITAHHVVHRDEKIQVGLPTGETVPATLVGRDPSTDLAVLKAEASGLTPFTEVSKDKRGVGHLALALGRPGQSVQTTLGIISALGGEWRTPHGGQIERYLQTDVVMYPGFSGGPLVSAGGELIGLNSSALLPGHSIAVPVPTLARVAEALLAHGRMRRGYLGISTQRVRLPESLVASLGQKRGLLVVSVEAGSTAEQAGLTLGDTLVTFNGQAIQRHEDLVAQLAGDAVGQSVPVRIVRGGQVQEMSVVVGERP